MINIINLLIELSIAALGADYLEILSIPDRKIIAQYLPKGDMMPTLQSELFSM
jgi:hypothetical protein